MTKGRAQYILDNRLIGGSLKYSFVGKHGAKSINMTFEDGMTEKEVKEVLKVWEEMDGNTSFISALIKIAHESVE